jgi:Leucine-rich repeat (LRR) protein
MSDPGHLDLVVNSIKDNIGLTNMSNLRHLDLADNQVQDNMGLANISNLRYLNLVVNQVQNNNYTPLSTPKGMTNLHWV